MDVQLTAGIIGAVASIVSAVITVVGPHWLKHKKPQLSEDAEVAIDNDAIAKRESLPAGQHKATPIPKAKKELTTPLARLVLALLVGLFVYAVAVSVIENNRSLSQKLETMASTAVVEFWNSPEEARMNYRLKPVQGSKSFEQGEFGFMDSSNLRLASLKGFGDIPVVSLQTEKNPWEVDRLEEDYVRFTAYATPGMVDKIKSATVKSPKVPIYVEVRIYPKPLATTRNVVSIPIHRLADVKIRILDRMLFAQVVLNVGAPTDREVR